tara:strand:+ start:123 stop:638 length:516 start_codon:yes stop_codon:yes gene_type:complete
MPDPSTINVRDLIPESCRKKRGKDTIGRKKGGITKFTPQTMEAILRNVAIGLPEGRAAQLAGIRAGTLTDWKKDHQDVAEALARAGAVAQDELYGVVRKGMDKNPRLALEVLERRFPKEWAAHSKHAHAGIMMQTTIPPEMMTALYSGRAGRDGGPTDSESIGSNEKPIEI